MSRTVPILLLLVVASLTFPPTGAIETQATHYVATQQGAIACAPEPHPILPTEEPDPQDPASLLSGEPECAFADAHNAVREAQGQERTWHGLGGARHAYDAGDDGSVASAGTDDMGFGVGTAYLHVMAQDWATRQPVASEGCGPQSITLPNSPRPHSEGEPHTFWWAFVHSVGVTDGLDVCFASAGVLQGSWGYEA